jgi:transposase
MGVFAWMTEGLASDGDEERVIMIDATYLRARRTASSLRVKKGGQNTKLHAVTDAKRCPLWFFMTAGQVSDYTGAAALLSSLPGAEWLIADRGYDTDWLREALRGKGVRPYDKLRNGRRKRIETIFSRLKDLRRIATHFDRCAKTFLSAVALAATVLLWL